jgi:hypothetical protein
MSKSRDRQFPPPKICDLDQRSASNFMSLLRKAKTTPITIVLGSGASASAGLPIWNDLLKKICASFFSHWINDIRNGSANIEKPPKELSIAFTAKYIWGTESEEIARDYLKGDLTLLAQQIKNCIRDIDWIYLLRKCLYTDDYEEYININNSELLNVLAKLCIESSNIKSIVNYNYDDIFETYVNRYDIKPTIIWEDKYIDDSDRLIIYHPHGYLRRDGGPRTNIILAENEYHVEYGTPYSWSNLVQVRQFTNTACVLIGSSMLDANLRRLLRVNTRISSMKHYVFLPQGLYISERHRMYNSLFDNDLLRLGVKVIRYPKVHSLEDRYSRLPELIELLKGHLVNGKSIWE